MEQKSVWLRKEQTSAALGILHLQIAFRRSLQFSMRAGPLRAAGSRVLPCFPSPPIPRFLPATTIPAFSGLLIDKAKRFRINGNFWWQSTYMKRQLIPIGMI
jgi:hypothetical protein